MKYLLGFSYYKYETDVKSSVDTWLARLRKNGVHIESFPLTLNPPGPPLTWAELNSRWRKGDKELLALYKNLARELENYDAFINYNGINIHPGFVKTLPTFNVFCCFDDPESSDNLSKPVARAYDLALVGNIAEVESYRSWGVKEARYWPLGFHDEDYNPGLTKEDILSHKRSTDISILCERQSPWRQRRLDTFTQAYPDGAYYGKGWPKGFLPEKDRVPLLQNTKIGVNFHNSTGPINFRTFQLPANGVMQICDNKKYLGKIFTLNKEAVGFDTVEEAIELCHYYLDNDEERKEIAAAGWERAVRDYNETAVFLLLDRYVNELKATKKQNDERLKLNNMHAGKYYETLKDRIYSFGNRFRKMF